MSNGSDILHWLARAGYAARGVVYLVVGYLAATAAWSGTKPKGTKGALQDMWSGPWGNVILIALGLGLILFAAWRLLQSLMDRDNHGTSAKGLVIRAGLLASAVTYTLLALFALRYLSGGGSSGSGDGSSSVAAFLLSQPFGRALLGAWALAIIGVGIAHFWKAYKKKFLDHMNMSRKVERWATPVSQFGLAMRGVTFLIIGGFFVAAAIQGLSQEAAGLAKALSAVQDLAYGWILLAVIALGLVAFGLYSLIEAVWRRVDVPGERAAGREASEAKGAKGQAARARAAMR